MKELLKEIFITDYKLRKEIKNLFPCRVNYCNEDYINTFFADSKVDSNIIIKVRGFLIAQLGEEMSLVYPDDDWTNEFRKIWELDSLGDVELILGIEKEFNIKIEDNEFQTINTFRNLVTLINNKT